MIETNYTKLFSSIVTSTIWREDDKTRIVWITLLALKNRHGEVSGSVPGLAALANVSIKHCQSALLKLTSPDIHSRTKEFDGRRIEPIDGGWRILNAGKYRNAMSEDERRSYKAKWMAQKRKTQSVDKSVDMSMSTWTHTDTDTDTDTSVHTHISTPKHIGTADALTECASDIAQKKTLNPLTNALRSGLCVMYKRPENDPWSYAEQCLLIEVLKRPEPMKDFQTIKDFRRRMTQKRFFPQTIERLLTDWPGTLDRARVAVNNPSLCA